MKITSIKRYEKDKEGKPYVGKFGPYTRLLVQVEGEYAGKDISFFENPKSPSLGWNVGDEVSFNVKQNGQYLNGEYIKATSTTGAMTDEIAKRVYRIEQMVNAIGIHLKVGKQSDNEDYPDGPNPDSVPF